MQVNDTLLATVVIVVGIVFLLVGMAFASKTKKLERGDSFLYIGSIGAIFFGTFCIISGAYYLLK